jgi:hypothetical protein
MADETTKWERETFTELLDIFDDDEDVCVVLDANDIEEEKVCVKPVEVNEPDGSGPTKFFLIWRADNIICHNNLLWSWKRIPGVWNVGYQGGWKYDAERQCQTCGARYGTWCKLVGIWEGIEKVKEVVEKMRYNGFEPDVGKAWLAHGFTITEAEKWAKEFSPEEAKEWKTLCDDYILSFDEIIDWRDYGFSVSEVYKWASWRTEFEPDEAAEWRDAGFDPENARDWRDAEFEPDEAAKWRDAGFGVEKAYEWRDAGFAQKKAQETDQECRDAEFEPDEAAKGYDAGIDVEMACELQDPGLDQNNAPKTAQEWHNTKSNPNEVTNNHHSGFDMRHGDDGLDEDLILGM